MEEERLFLTHREVLNNKPFTIRVDFREDNARIGEILAQEYGINVLRQSLKAGDYILDDAIIVERKTAADFVQSIIDGRLFKQAIRLKQALGYPIFIIEGGNLYENAIDIHPHAVKGALISLCLAWQIPVVFSDNEKDTALLLWLMLTQDSKFYNELSYRPGRRPKRLHKRQLYISQGLPNIGPRLAHQLLNHFGSVENVITASGEKLMQVPGLGKIRSKKIKEVLSNDYKR
jgi:DNA excision repair protein ERCC-4